VAIGYLKSDADAKETKGLVEAEGRRCLQVKGDLSKEANCRKLINSTIKEYGYIDILVNNAGMHEEDDEMKQISTQQLKRTFEVNIFSFFYCTKEMLNQCADDAVIINTASVTAYRGSEHLIDYAATKGAIVSFTRSLAKNLAAEGKRVNAVAPGPVWTPLVINAFDEAHLKKFGKDTPMGRAGYPYEIAPAYVYLASQDSAYMTGQVLHLNGGDIINS
jgi:NAD(P)-dependent dehydrogenase (short-subunit alcohol dehydrogenase family)